MIKRTSSTQQMWELIAPGYELPVIVESACTCTMKIMHSNVCSYFKPKTSCTNFFAVNCLHVHVGVFFSVQNIRQWNCLWILDGVIMSSFLKFDSNYSDGQWPLIHSTLVQKFILSVKKYMCVFWFYYTTKIAIWVSHNCRNKFEEIFTWAFKCWDACILPV